METDQLWAVLMLAVAISVDGFSVGVTYGIRRIKISILPLLIIGFISTLSIYLTGSLGAGIAKLLNRELANFLGSLILVGIGIWLIYPMLNNTFTGETNRSIRKKGSESFKTKEDEHLIISLKIKSLGIVIRIFKEPTKADFDNSGTINLLEAFFLGLALALDALGAGLGAGMSGFPTIIVPLAIGFMNLLFVGAGVVIGKKLGNIIPVYFEVIPGFIIIFLGLVKLI